jgi:hypothetical protein
MGDIGDYIYLIILAIAGISSLLKNKKKPQELMPEPTSEYDLEEVLRKLDETEYENYPQPAQEIEKPFAAIPKVNEQPVTVQYESVKQYMEKMEKEKKRQKIADTKADPFAKRNAERRKRDTDANNAIIFAENEANNQLDYSFATVDEAKRAFVYSEIFNRKYS